MKTMFWKRKYDARLPECPPGHHVLGKYNQCSICLAHIAPNNMESATAKGPKPFHFAAPPGVDRYAPPAASRTTPQPPASGYPGSKGGNGVWHQIVAQIPPHDLYVEAFAGSAQVLLRMRPPAAVIAIDCAEEVCQNLRAVIAGRADLARVTSVVCDTAAHWLERNKARLNRRTVVYCDPPYLADVRSEPGRAYYESEMDLAAQHCALLDVLKVLTTQGVQCLISGYASPLYDERLLGWRRIEYRAMTRGGPVIECLWCNFGEPTELHDPRVAASVSPRRRSSRKYQPFRERERIKRRAASMVKQLRAMPAAERAAVLAAIDEWRRSSSQ
jgi:DNA adenine methylase